MAAIGYIRQSKRADLDVALSYDSQLAAIRRLAQRDGIDPDDVTVLSDMGRSGGHGKERLRAGYQDLIAAIDRRSVDTVYALSMSRIARSTVELHGFYERCRDAGVRVVYDKESVDFSTPGGRMYMTILSAFYTFERDLAVERAKDNVAVRRAREERMGRVPYGERTGDQPAAVVSAYHEAQGSLNGTALLLNQRGIRSWAGRDWTGTAVRLVIGRLVPGVIPNRPTRGVKPSSPFLLYRLLRCPCGRTMTASRDGRGNRDVVYRCHAADTLPDHPRPYRVRESVVLPWVVAEAARYRPPKGVKSDRDRAKERAAIVERRDKLALHNAEKRLSDTAYAREDGALAVELDKLDAAARVTILPNGVDWTWSPEHVNNVLRSFLSHVVLDEQLHPVDAAWLLPEWRDG